MSDLFLDLRDQSHTLDFIANALEYVAPTARKRLEQDLEEVTTKRALAIEELATLAKEIGKKSWAARRALAKWLHHQDGCDMEWRKVVATVSDSTAHILERFRHGTACTSLDAVLAHEESGSALRDLERFEIAEVRRHVRHDIWREKHRNLSQDVDAAEKKLVAIARRLGTLRELAGDAPWIQDEIMSKLEHWEDRLYFKGEELDVKLLDEEIRLYREEKEIPTTS
ncbi:hypothetical protein A3E39_03610 [Candidatus Uhrbacteria bacterium RIFCSPHIGHO2_12_FULL_60_25]|uniref:Uncharacterized protein n=1 Tax=Candidatus Uhrbacteria bacterium RIFCSPHIGHO2_12_FULL_60_25 TaxID=1802399 RepID=A0A1F7UMU4_9BACT|nr:MAG: hypothetical protein A3D73_03770 [Candidatus Uhrbacteria bacterium RIFCSPHIGHO2_02_FULL_60_44]OGL79007.1 MAG: hypothetical protein A3E39_03610 [Candidatus Uhrbacteria bacterium RIFCSPHIGHO2_12_FULL_60_25]